MKSVHGRLSGSLPTSWHNFEDLMDWDVWIAHAGLAVPIPTFRHIFDQLSADRVLLSWPEPEREE